jgi:uncharacterized membrane protein YdjX (TVP38/TMEM64 family)
VSAQILEIPPVRTVLRLLPALLILAALGAAYALGLHRSLNWAALGAQQTALRAMVADSPLAAAALYVASYVAIVAISLPVAVVATVTGGLLFGPVTGTLLTIVAATIGSSLTFFAVRTALFPLLAQRASGMMDRLGPRLRRDGLSYMLVLRLLPVVPFWLVNLAAGLSGMPWRLFALGTLIGIIPATAVFSSIGAGIGEVLARGGAPDLSVIFSAPILLPLVGLAALSLLPVVWRHVRGDDAAL